jgi:hypothetical protein
MKETSKEELIENFATRHKSAVDDVLIAKKSLDIINDELREKLVTFLKYHDQINNRSEFLDNYGLNAARFLNYVPLGEDLSIFQSISVHIEQEMTHAKFTFTKEGFSSYTIELNLAELYKAS